MPETAPPEPFTALAEGAHQTHELFIAYVDAGFTRTEALEIVKTILQTAIFKGPQPGGGQ